MRQRQSGSPGLEKAPTCILAPPAAAAAATAATAPAESPAPAIASTALALGPGHLHLDLPAVQLASVQLGDGLLRLLGRRHLDEAEALRAPGHLVGDDGGRGYRSGLAEEPPERLVRGVEAEPADKELLGHGTSPWSALGCGGVGCRRLQQGMRCRQAAQGILRLGYDSSGMAPAKATSRSTASTRMSAQLGSNSRADTLNFA